MFEKVVHNFGNSDDKKMFISTRYKHGFMPNNFWANMLKKSLTVSSASAFSIETRSGL